MHSAVLQNKKYIKFAAENTVEVISLGRLAEAVQKEDRKAAKYKRKGRDGKEEECMVAWPNLTYDEMIALNRSPAGRFNKSGKIPYTSIVDPHTLEEMVNWVGGQSAKTIMDAATTARKALMKEHGRGLSRKDLRRVDRAEAALPGLVEAMQYGKALSLIKKVAKGGEAWPQELSARVQGMRERVLEAAGKKVDEYETLGAEKPKVASRELGRLLSRLRGTGLEDRVRTLIKDLSSSR